MDLKEIFSVTLILFSVIDIVGSIPFIILIRQREGRIYAERATAIAAGLMVAFLYFRSIYFGFVWIGCRIVCCCGFYCHVYYCHGNDPWHHLD